MISIHADMIEHNDLLNCQGPSVDICGLTSSKFKSV